MTETTIDRVRSALRRVRLIAGQTWCEANRLRLGLPAAVVAALLVLAAQEIRRFNFGPAEIGFMADFGVGLIGLAGGLFAVLLTAHLFLSGVSSGTAACLLARGVRRWEWIAGVWIGIAAALGVFAFLMGGLLGALLAWRARDLGLPSVDPAALAVACYVQWMKFTLAAVLTLVVSAYAHSALFATCAGGLLVIIGHLPPFANNGWEWLRLWPNLGLFDAAGFLAGGPASSGVTLGGLAVYWAINCVWLGAVAAYAFRHREF